VKPKCKENAHQERDLEIQQEKIKLPTLRGGAHSE
jgi:hypothetical protein